MAQMTKYQMEQARHFISRIISRKIEAWEHKNPRPESPAYVMKKAKTNAQLEAAAVESYWSSRKEELATNMIQTYVKTDYNKTGSMLDIIVKNKGVQEEYSRAWDTEKERVDAIEASNEELEKAYHKKYNDWTVIRDGVWDKLVIESEKVLKKMLFGGTDVTADVAAFNSWSSFIVVNLAK